MNLLAEVNSAESSGATVFFVLLDGERAGYFVIADHLRPQAAAAIAALRSNGIRDVVMLTGDNPRATRSIARAAGIGLNISVHAGLPPEDKVAQSNELRERGARVAMVGDGA